MLSQRWHRLLLSHSKHPEGQAESDWKHNPIETLQKQCSHWYTGLSPRVRTETPLLFVCYLPDKNNQKEGAKSWDKKCVKKFLPHLTTVSHWLRSTWDDLPNGRNMFLSNCYTTLKKILQIHIQVLHSLLTNKYNWNLSKNVGLIPVFFYIQCVHTYTHTYTSSHLHWISFLLN